VPSFILIYHPSYPLSFKKLIEDQVLFEFSNESEFAFNQYPQFFPKFKTYVT